MDAIEAIVQRRSCRSFQDEPLPEELINELLALAMSAPSAGNQRPWQFYVVRGAETRKALSEASPYAGPAAKAPVNVVACIREDCLRFAGDAPYDLSNAIENLWLAATAKGLGCVWLGIAPEPDRVAHVAKVLDLPEGMVPFGLVCLGRPAKEPAPRTLHEPDMGRIVYVD